MWLQSARRIQQQSISTARPFVVASRLAYSAAAAGISAARPRDRQHTAQRIHNHSNTPAAAAPMSTNAHDADPGAPRTMPAGTAAGAAATAADGSNGNESAAGAASKSSTSAAGVGVARLKQGDRTRFLSRHYPVPLPTLGDKTLTFDDADSWPNDPMQVFSQWYIDAEHAYNSASPDRMDAPVHWPNTMQIATVSSSGFPSVRTVLLKGYDERGLVFFTNYDGAKGSALRADPRVALVFYWKNLERQVRVEGVAEMLTPAESDAYFHERPIQSQIGGVVSPQSRPIANHAELERAYVATVQGVAQQVQQHLDRDGAEGAAGEAELAATKDRVSELLTALSIKAAQQPHPASPPSAPASASASSNGGDGGSDTPLSAVAPLVAAPAPTPSEALATHEAHAQALASLQRLDSSPLTQPLLHSLVHRPPYWGGFLIRPLQVEFWCDGAYRLHSRIVYKQAGRSGHTKEAEKKPTAQVNWTKTFLAP